MKPPRFLKCEDMESDVVLITVAAIVSITNNFDKARGDIWVSCNVQTTRGHFVVNASMDQIEAALDGNGVVQFD